MGHCRYTCSRPMEIDCRASSATLAALDPLPPPCLSCRRTAVDSPSRAPVDAVQVRTSKLSTHLPYHHHPAGGHTRDGYTPWLAQGPITYGNIAEQAIADRMEEQIGPAEQLTALQVGGWVTTCTCWQRARAGTPHHTTPHQITTRSFQYSRSEYAAQRSCEDSVVCRWNVEGPADGPTCGRGAAYPRAEQPTCGGSCTVQTLIWTTYSVNYDTCS
jgi:hypothetical protein